MMILNLSAACHGKTEHGIFVKFKQTSKTAVVLLAGVTISGTPSGYSVPPALHRTIWCRSTFGPRGPGLSNPTSFLRPALPMAPTRDDNARDKRSVLRPGMGPRPSGSRQRPRPRPELPRPRRDRDVCQTVRDETETRPSSVRDETETRPFSGRDYIETHGLCYHTAHGTQRWYIYALHTVPPKKSLRLGWKKQVNNKHMIYMMQFKLPKQKNMICRDLRARHKLSKPRPRPRP